MNNVVILPCGENIRKESLWKWKLWVKEYMVCNFDRYRQIALLEVVAITLPAMYESACLPTLSPAQCVSKLLDMCQSER